MHLHIAPGGINIPRVYGNVNDEDLHLLDEMAGAQGAHRSDLVGKAIVSLLHPVDAPPSTQEGVQVQEILHLRELLKVQESEILHLRGLTLDLRSLADNMASKIPALPPGEEEIKANHWWQFWK